MSEAEAAAIAAEAKAQAEAQAAEAANDTVYGPDSWAVDNGTLSIACQDLEAIPDNLASKFGADTKLLDVSFNSITTLDHLEGFTKIETLVADNNTLKGAQPGLAAVASTLRVLSVNNNSIDDLDAFLDSLVPLQSLRILSMLKNPACPSMFFGGDSEDYARHRLYVINKLRKLDLLDTQPVTAKERAEAIRRGAFLKTAKPEEKPQSEQPANAEAERSSDDDILPGLNQQMTAPGRSGPAKYGVCSYVYYGKQSEGNRFILNEDL